MSDPAKTRRSVFRFSLKSLLLSVVPISIGLAALRNATDAWASAIVTFTILAIFAATLVAIFGTGSGRAVAASFVMCCGGYMVLITLADEGLVTSLATQSVNELLLKELHPTIESPYPESYSWFRPFVTSQIRRPDEGNRQAAYASGNVPCVSPASTLTCSLRFLTAILAFEMADADAGGSKPPASQSASTTTTVRAGDTAEPVPPVTDPFAENQQLNDDPASGVNFMQIAHCLWALICGSSGALLASYLTRRNHEATVGTIADGSQVS